MDRDPTASPSTSADRTRFHFMKTARRQQALARLRRLRIRRSLKAESSVVPGRPESLVRLAGETIQLIEQRIAYWLQVGDEAHVRRLEEVRQKLLNTYRA